MSHTPIKYRIWSEEQDQEKSRQSRAGRQYEWAVQECPVHLQEAKRCSPYHVSTKKWEEWSLTGKYSIRK